jgi:membrane-bound ClpP family serine protease
MPLTYSFGLLALFYLLMLAEFFIPSGGMVGVVAAAAGIASIAIAFTHSVAAGMTFLGVISLSTPAVLVFMVKYWPHTPIGRGILNRRPGQMEEPTEHRLRTGERRKELVGRIGVAKTDLLPSGMIVIDRLRLDAVSEGSPIDAGTEVVVISTIAGKIRVRPATPEDVTDEVDGDMMPQVNAELESFDFDALED